LMSMTGEEAFSLNYYDRKMINDYEASLTVDDFTKVVISLDFGRWLWDTDWALDPKRFSSLQLKITHSEALANTSVVINELIVEAMVFDEKVPTPKGFFSSKEIFTYTPTASGSEFIDLPTDHTIRKLLIQSDSTDKNPFEVIDNIKLSEENDKKIPFSIDGEEFYRTWAHEWPPIVYNMILDAVATAKTIFAIGAYHQMAGVNIEYDATPFVTAQSTFAVPTYTNNKIVLALSVDIKGDRAEITGRIPFSIMCWPFGSQADDNDWYSVGTIKSLQLIIKSASSVGTTPEAQIVLQQARLY